MVTWYCQACNATQVLTGFETADTKPCINCGSTHLLTTPKPHARYFYELTDYDRIFLRVQRIDPEEE